jgi:beta-fructofuranosidase
MWKFNPQMSQGNDYNTWDWGGSMIVHRLIQNPDGTLAVTVPETVEQAISVARTVAIEPLNGAWELADGTARVDSPYAYASALLPRIPDECRLEAEVCFEGSPRQFGIALQVDEKFDLGYYLCFEPYRSRVQFKTGLRMVEEGGKMFPYEVEMERPIALKPGVDYAVKIFVQDTILEVYINAEIALSARMFNYTGRRFGLFVSEGEAHFKNIKLFTIY